MRSLRPTLADLYLLIHAVLHLLEDDPPLLIQIAEISLRVLRLQSSDPVLLRLLVCLLLGSDVLRSLVHFLDALLLQLFRRQKLICLVKQVELRLLLQLDPKFDLKDFDPLFKVARLDLPLLELFFKFLWLQALQTLQVRKGRLHLLLLLSFFLQVNFLQFLAKLLAHLLSPFKFFSIRHFLRGPGHLHDMFLFANIVLSCIEVS